MKRESTENGQKSKADSRHAANKAAHPASRHAGARKPASKKPGLGGSGSASGRAALKPTARDAALKVLTHVEEAGAYSNLKLNQILKESDLPRQDAALATEIVYGTIQRRNTIDYYLAKLVTKGDKGLSKLQPWVLSLLRMSLYQLLYLERVPDHAIVSEAVNIAKRKGHQGISGMVNGVLRSAIRRREELILPDGLDDTKRIALQYSHPEWLVRRWIAQHGVDACERICAANNEAPHVSIRANVLRGEAAGLLERLRGEGLDAQLSALSPSGIVVSSGGNMALAAGFAKGDYSVQDESSMLVAEALEPKPGMKVLDCCAAPGGKTAHIAEKMGDTGEVWACDLHPHKQKLIDEQAERLGLESVRTFVKDARELSEEFAPESFDRILLDAPCSGFGVIRRKPDLKWSKQESDIKEIRSVQKSILEAVHGLLKPGGILIYSTCTIEREENEAAVEQFLKAHTEFKLDPIPAENWPDSGMSGQASSGMIRITPDQYGTDGFFIARLRKE
ncbi:16S rRNA (cytosine(967)-C(5))-methyltransferase RsmB [Paenibacillus sp. FJAT-26967]|uniref:16S rRNA (cytosine(967)-C(5))-methyltransferase RsmB n=1 Tax=Paenibacillus sp. FJAT-26967 TaxID=1729690 RepID=UPI000837B134|nr:16S rRNA (cytosine(967)-C(5))-methyltransferase RsmB [Paenibacillus sp. FJAT-26967]